MRKILTIVSFIFCSLILILPTYAESTQDEAEQITYSQNMINIETESVSVPECVSGENETNHLDFISIDELLSNSINVMKINNITIGTYQSGKMETGLPGYKYRIEFDWEIEEIGGEYVFKNNSISNATITTYTNHIVLILAFDYYNYRIVTNTYSVNYTSVTFNTDYEFTVQRKNSSVLEVFVERNTRTIGMDEIM